MSDTAATLVADLRGLHQRAAHPNDDQCWICHHPYPCPTVRLCDEVDTRVKWADQLLQREVIRRKQYRAERDRLRASRDHLASLLERSRPFMQDATHSVGCGAGCSWVGGDCYADHDHICTCGLADLLTEMENG